MDKPVYLSIDGDVRGLSVTVETPKEIEIERYFLAASSELKFF